MYLASLETTTTAQMTMNDKLSFGFEVLVLLSVVIGVPANNLYFNSDCSLDTLFRETNDQERDVACETRTFDTRTRNFDTVPSVFWDQSDVSYVERLSYRNTACTLLHGEWERFRLNYSSWLAAAYLGSAKVTGVCGNLDGKLVYYQEDQFGTKWFPKEIGKCLQGPNDIFEVYLCHNTPSSVASSSSSSSSHSSVITTTTITTSSSNSNLENLPAQENAGCLLNSCLFQMILLCLSFF